MERRLSAILAADIVGYSAQMERDESGTFARVTARRREVFEPEIARHQGRIFKLMGDGILAEFGSVVQAVECAMSIQLALHERNAAVPEEQAIRARIGINLGEVIVDGDDRYGEGVNIAARLEGLADPGGICVSEKVAREVEKKLAFGFVPMGPQKVKNIAEPIHVFRVSRDPAPRRQLPAGQRRVGMLAGGVLAFALAVATAVAILWPAPGSDGPPVLAVAPFALPEASDEAARNVTGEVTESLVRILGTSPDLRAVVPLDPALQGDAMRPDYVLMVGLVKGTPYDAFDIRLLDGPDGTPLWSGRREFRPADYLSERTRIAERLYSSLVGAQGEILRLEAARARPSFGSASAHGVHLEGRTAFMEGTAEGWQRAEDVWHEGLQQHPGSRQLQLDLAFLAYRRAPTQPPDVAAREIAAAWLVVNEVGAATGLTAGETWLYHYLRAVLLPPMLGDFAAAVAEAEKAHALAPWHPTANADLSLVMANGGRADTAIEWATYAVETEVNPPEWYRAALAWAYVCSDRLAEALAVYQGLSDPVRPEHALTLMLLGRDAESRAMFDALAKREGVASVEDRLAQGVGGRQPRAMGRAQEIIEFGVWKLNLGKPRKPVQVVDGGTQDTGRRAKIVAKAGRKAKAALKAPEPRLDDLALVAPAPAEVIATMPPPVTPVVPDQGPQDIRVLRPVTDHLRIRGFALPSDYLTRGDKTRGVVPDDPAPPAP